MINGYQKAKNEHADFFDDYYGIQVQYKIDSHLKTFNISYLAYKG